MFVSRITVSKDAFYCPKPSDLPVNTVALSHLPITVTSKILGDADSQRRKTC